MSTNNTILYALEEERVFKASLNEDKTRIVIAEQCDQVYEMALFKTKALQLIQELTELVNQMK